MSVVIRADWGIGKLEFYEGRSNGWHHNWTDNISEAKHYNTQTDAMEFIEQTWNGVTTKIVCSIEILDADTQEVLYGLASNSEQERIDEHTVVLD